MLTPDTPILLLKIISNLLNLFGPNRIIKRILISRRDIRANLIDIIAHYDTEHKITHLCLDILYEKPCVLIKLNNQINFYIDKKVETEVPGKTNEDYSYYINIISKVFDISRNDFYYIYKNIQKVDKDVIYFCLENEDRGF